MNVFNDQMFLLRRPPGGDGGGEPVRLSFREIMTGAAEGPLWFDYPLEYMNAAALGLCAALAQVLFDPADTQELAALLRKPVAPQEFDERTAPFVEAFSIDGDIRFMGWTGPPPERDKKGRLKDAVPFASLLLSSKKGDKEFLNRPDEDWCVSVDQIPVLLFSRSTFYEKSAGRGYLTGTSGEMEIRTFPVDPASLRRTVVLNVLTRDRQDTATATAYDGWFWMTPPDEREVARDEITLRSALFWMVAKFHVELGELERPRRCIVTGELIAAGERAGVALVTTSTGFGFGAKMPGANGVEVRSSFFLHPNGPYVDGITKKEEAYKRHLTVRTNSGLVGQMAGLFFGADDTERRRTLTVAPVVDQLNMLRLQARRGRRGAARVPLHGIQLYCFGFHMLSAKANVHGGYESERYVYPLVQSREYVGGMLSRMAQFVEQLDGVLGSALQICTLTGVAAQKDEATGRISYKIIDRPGEVGMLTDATQMLWRAAGGELHVVLKKIDDEIAQLGDDADENTERDCIADRQQGWIEAWEDAMMRYAERIFHATFDDYVSSPVYMVAGHSARRFFYGAIAKIAPGVIKRRQHAYRNSELEEVAR